VEPDYVTRHFVPLALDTYFRGNAHEVAFCQKVHAGGNHLIVATVAGRVLGKEGLRLRQSDLEGVLREYARLPRGERTPTLEDPARTQPPKRAVPKPPAGGLIVRGYCTYLRQDEKKEIVRSSAYYYRENPDRWRVETQSDLLWLTESEWRSLIPANPRPGGRAEVTPAIRKRFYSTIGIDYMEGSVNSLPVRQTTMTLTVQRVNDRTLVLRLEGHAQLGQELDEKRRSAPNSRGCELRVVGEVRYDRKKQAIERFDIAGVGRAWGNKMNYVHREIRLDEYPWMYGIAWEVVTGDSPQDRIPPYNLLHYNSTGPYFGTR
jgi:hypothetical protein